MSTLAFPALAPVPVLTALVSSTGDALHAPPSGPDMTRYTIVCVGLLASVLVLAWVFKRFVGTSLKRRASKRSLQVLDVLPLGGKHKLVVVRCYDRSFLIGVGDKELSSIAELDPQAEDDVVPATAPRANTKAKVAAPAANLGASLGAALEANTGRAARVPLPFRSKLAEVLRAKPRAKAAPERARVAETTVAAASANAATPAESVASAATAATAWTGKDGIVG